MSSKQEIEPMLELLGDELKAIAGDNFNYIQLYFERILAEYTLNNDLWMLYVSYMEDKCNNREAKLDLY
jgi:hypothetical protein